jgi:hypothetical protein
MNPTAFAAWLKAIAAADAALAGLIVLGRSVREELSSDDQAALDAKLAVLESLNDAAFARIDAKLSAAATR